MQPAFKSVSCRPWSYSANCFSTTGIKSSGENEKNRSGVISLLASLHYRLNGWVPRHCFPLLLPLANWEAENQSESVFTTTSEPRKPGVQHKLWTITICVFFFLLFAHTQIPTSSVAAFPIHAMPNIRQTQSGMWALRLITHCLPSGIFPGIHPPADTLYYDHFTAASISCVHRIVAIYHLPTALWKCLHKSDFFVVVWMGFTLISENLCCVKMKKKKKRVLPNGLKDS